MSQNIIGTCPICKEKLVASKLSCKNCGLELTNDFTLNKFSYLSNEELAFIELFLQESGNLKEIQKQLKLSYPAAKKQLEKIQRHLGLDVAKEKPVKIEPVITELPIYDDDSLPIRSIKKKLNASGGVATLTLPKGKTFQIYYEEFGSGICATNLPSSRVLPWSAFWDAIELLERSGGKAPKGNAMQGKLGSAALPLDSVEGYVALHTFRMKKGDSCPRMISSLSAILEWAGLCKNGYGYLELV